MPELMDVTPGTTTCARCGKPAEFEDGHWQHAEWTDALDCIRFFGGGFITDDEEPERGGATSAWEHHHG